MFRLGDKVRIKLEHKKEWIGHNCDRVGTITIVQETSEKQWCRVQFSGSMLDYEDVGAWRLELV